MTLQEQPACKNLFKTRDTLGFSGNHLSTKIISSVPKLKKADEKAYKNWLIKNGEEPSPDNLATFCSKGRFILL